ncbi:MAG: cysteine hydrolase [Clostridia bacterium]|nr:cysteine hydrolase [Clostridia bacterium]
MNKRGDINNFLIIIDMQNDFLKSGSDRFISHVCEKIEKRRAEGYGVLLTLDRHGGGKHGEAVTKKISHLTADCRAYEKNSYGCKKLIEDLAAIKPSTVEFAGVCTDICVICNALAAKAFLPETEIVIDAKCCLSETKKGQKSALAVMRACGVTVLNDG